MVETIFLGIIYYILSFSSHSDWDSSILEHKPYIELGQSSDIFADYSLWSSPCDSEGLHESSNLEFDSYHIKYDFNMDSNLKFTLDYTSSSLYNSRKYNDCTNSFTYFKENYNANLLLLDVAYTGLSTFYEIKPIIFLNVGLLNINTDHNKYDAANNYTFLESINTKQQFVVLDSKLKLFWQPYFFKLIIKPIFYTELGAMFKENNQYNYLSIGGYCIFMDKLIVNAQYGSSPIFSQPKKLVSNYTISIMYPY